MRQFTTDKGLHVAVILDGNGRWAEAHGLPRIEGHRAGAGIIQHVVEAAPDLGIGALTLYAFSSDNWKRPRAEVSALLALMQDYLETEAGRCQEKGVRVSVIGSKRRLSEALRRAIEFAEGLTAEGRALDLRIALDYSSRDAIVAAVGRLKGNGAVSRQAFASALANDAGACDVDLLIRTGGEKRLSDFLLWECAYAELYFTDAMWPEFDAGALAAAIREFRSRERRFGRIQMKAAAGFPPAGNVAPRNGGLDFWLR